MLFFYIIYKIDDLVIVDIIGDNLVYLKNVFNCIVVVILVFKRSWFNCWIFKGKFRGECLFL